MKTFSHKLARYSVVRIEQAKQKVLTGRSWKTVKIRDGVVPDWNADDEEALCILIDQWDEKTGHQGLNDLVDHYQFSHGTNYENSGLKQKLETVILYPDGKFLKEPQIEVFTAKKHDNLGAGTIQYLTSLWRPDDLGLGYLLNQGYRVPTVINRSELSSMFRSKP